MGCGSSTSTGVPSHTRDNRTPSPGGRGRGRNSPDPDSRGHGRHREKDFVQEALESHNEYRSWHDAPPLTVAKDLNAYSQKWADKIAKRDTMEHSNCTMDSGERVGENIYYSWSSDPSAKPNAHDAVKSWYDEIKDYDFNNATFGMNTGHFTQVVWKGSREMGIGKARSPKGSWFVVANYRPAGNMMGDFENNVLPRGHRSNI